jgi:teichuronic acid exporter
VDRSKTSHKNTILKSLAWKLLERGGSNGISFIMQLVLARLLLPSDYGIVALVSVFIAIAAIFVQSGIGTSLIQKKEIDNLDISSVFYLSLSIALFLYFILFITAPWIASFYENQSLIKVTRVLSLTLIIGSFNTVQTALLSRNMQFRSLFFCNVGASIFSGIAGITLAYLGFGVWALVIQQLVRELGVTLILFVVVSWKPTLNFSIQKVKELYSFGWKLMASSLLTTVYQNLRNLVIGKKFSPSTLGYYNKGSSFPAFLITNVSGSIQSVLFPALAAHQDDLERIKLMTRRSVSTSSFLVFPMMVGIMAVAKPLVLIVLTDKWLASVPFLQIVAVAYAFRPISAANLQALNALGRSDIYLRLQIIKRVMGLSILAVSLFFGIYGIVIGEVIADVASFFVNVYPNRKILKYGYREQAKDILPSFILSLAMGVVVYLITLLSFSPLMTMSIQIVVGVVFYFSVAWLLKLECFTYLIETVKPIVKTRYKKS